MSLPRININIVERGDHSGWTVDVGEFGLHEISAHTTDRVRIPVAVDGKPQEITELLDRMAEGNPRQGDATLYGRWLFDCLLAPVWEKIRKSLEDSKAQGVELALCWPRDQYDLHPLVWEAMHDGNVALAGHPDLLIAITRLVDVEVKHRPPIKEPRLLLAVGASADDEVIRSGAMLMGLLRSFDANGLWTTRFEEEVTLKELASLCDSFKPHVLHLVTHGTVERGRCLLQIDSGYADRMQSVDARALVTAITEHGELSMAVLSACHSGGGSAHECTLPLAIEVVSGGVPIVVGMTGEVSEQACRLYTRRMIDAIQQGLSIVEASAKGRRAALTLSADPGEHLDWAMPAIFLAAAYPQDGLRCEPVSAKVVSSLARTLRLSYPPIFIGRREMLQIADHLFATGGEAGAEPIGFVVAWTPGSLSRLGGTRLLREMGNRLLRQGHIPLLLGPYNTDMPVDLRTFSAEVLERCLDFAHELELPPPILSVLAESPAPDGRNSDYTPVWELLEQFESDDAHLPPKTLRSKLRNDLNGLAEMVAKYGPPFGSHTRPVILGDQAHTWLGAVDALLDLVGANGLGTNSHPVPVILTSSTLEDSGPAIDQYMNDNRGAPGCRFPELGVLSHAEATLGFQWVLLNPWRKDQKVADPVYAAARGVKPADLNRALMALQGFPAAVEDELYMIAKVMAGLGTFVSANDDADYKLQIGRFR